MPLLTGLSKKRGVCGKVIVLSGMAFKGRPETSDLRGSSSVNIARKLHAAGFSLRIHDFSAYPEELRALNLGEVFTDLAAACEGAAALLVLNNHRKYSELELTVPCAVLDIWQVCRKIRAPEYFTVGNLLISEG